MGLPGIGSSSGAGLAKYGKTAMMRRQRGGAMMAQPFANYSGAYSGIGDSQESYDQNVPPSPSYTAPRAGLSTVPGMTPSQVYANGGPGSFGARGEAAQRGLDGIMSRMGQMDAYSARKMAVANQWVARNRQQRAEMLNQSPYMNNLRDTAGGIIGGGAAPLRASAQQPMTEQWANLVAHRGQTSTGGGFGLPEPGTTTQQGMVKPFPVDNYGQTGQELSIGGPKTRMRINPHSGELEERNINYGEGQFTTGTKFNSGGKGGEVHVYRTADGKIGLIGSASGGGETQLSRAARIGREEAYRRSQAIRAAKQFGLSRELPAVQEAYAHAAHASAMAANNTTMTTELARKQHEHNVNMLGYHNDASFELQKKLDALTHDLNSGKVLNPKLTEAQINLMQGQINAHRRAAADIMSGKMPSFTPVTPAEQKAPSQRPAANTTPPAPGKGYQRPLTEPGLDEHSNPLGASRRKGVGLDSIVASLQRMSPEERMQLASMNGEGADLQELGRRVMLMRRRTAGRSDSAV